MAELLSVGLDVGTTTTQLIFSRLQVENRAGAFAVPELDITQRQVVYESPVHFTPLVGKNLVDAQALRELVAEEYRRFGVTPQQVDTGAVIITGETSRKENARQVLEALSDFAGDFVVATAGPHLESVLAAKGAGAVEASREGRLLHMDIGGGTSNLALLEDGKILQTGCLNVGGRLVKFDQAHKITYLSPVLQGLTDLQVGETVTEERLRPLGKLLCRALEMAAGLRPGEELLERLSTAEAGKTMEPAPDGCRFCFSGGVAECVHHPTQWDRFGDLGPVLGNCIRESPLYQRCVPGSQTLRATVIGAGCHSTQLSGSTVFCHGVALPLKNLPVVSFDRQQQESPDLPRLIDQRCSVEDTTPVLAFPGMKGDYGALRQLAQRIASAGVRPLYVAVEQDMAKALGQRLCLERPGEPVLCLDGLRLDQGSFLDVGKPLGPTFPVVIKTLVLSK